MDFNSLPKIELHCHLDGSLNIDMTNELLRKQGKIYEMDELRDKLTCSDDCSSLAEYLERFALPNEVLQTREDIIASTKAFALDLAAENVRYVEVRFAPAFSKGAGLKVGEIIDAVNAGLDEAKTETGIMSGILVCAMRHLLIEDNIEMFREARERLGAGVVGCDIAGDEKPHTNLEVKELFAEAKRLGMPYTIHSGECGRALNVKEAVEIGASRVGHGIAMSGHEDIIRLCRDKAIGIEMCPISNLQTKAINDISAYPFREFMDAGLLTTINTDNRTVSNTSLLRELELIDKTFGIDPDTYKKLYTNAVDVSFASDDIKEALLKVKL